MIRRIWTAYTVELSKALRLRSTFVGPALVVLAVLAALLAHPVTRNGVSDYAFIAYATPMALNLLGLVLVLAYCAGLVAPELSTGTIRTVLVRPLRRHEFLAAKLALGMTYAAALMVLVGALSWLLGWVLGELSGVSYGGEMVFTAQDMRRAYLVGMLLSLAPMFATVSYAVMMSTLIRSPGAAVGATLGVWFMVDIAKHPAHVAPYLFTTYLEMPWRVFAGRSDVLDVSWMPEVNYCVATSLVSAGVFVVLAQVVLARRNLQA